MLLINHSVEGYMYRKTSYVQCGLSTARSSEKPFEQVSRVENKIVI